MTRWQTTEHYQDFNKTSLVHYLSCCLVGTCPAVHPVLSLLFIELSPHCLLLCVACNKAAVSLQPLVVESGVCLFTDCYLFTDCCQKFYTSFLLVYVVRHSVITFNVSSVEHVDRDCYYHYMLPLHMVTTA